MWKLIISLIASTAFVPQIAAACSCSCEFEHTVSDYFEDHILFWGLPTNSLLTKNDLVNNEVRVIESYDQLNSREVVKVKSNPEDGGSCGYQLKVGVTQLIVAHTQDSEMFVSTCVCSPPIAYAIEYLREGTDRYLPSLDKCWDEKTGDINLESECQVWREAQDEWQAERTEFMRVIQLLEDD